MNGLFALVGLAVTAVAATAAEPARKGNATFYDYPGIGACSVPAPGDIYTAAMNATDYETALACGGVITVQNTQNGKSVKVRIDDKCPDCPPGHVDLTREAFARIADPALGIVPIKWKYVAYNTPTIKLFFDPGSNPWYAAVQVRNHRYRVAKLAYRPSGSGAAFVNVVRSDWNFFIKPDGMGAGPFDFRLTDVYGQKLTVKNVPFTLGQEITVNKQFPTQTP